MKHFIKLVLLPLILMLSQFSAQSAKVDPVENAKVYAARWISELNLNVTQSDIIKIVETAFEQGARHRIDSYIILSIIKKESTFNKKAKNHTSASGLMQVVSTVHKGKINGRDIFKITTNIEVGTVILRQCMDKHSENITRSLRCYRGVNDAKYINDILKTRNDIQRWVVENQFQSYLPVHYASFNSNPITY